MTDHYVAARQRREMPSANRSRERAPRTRHYVMTPPAYFAIEYSIKPWMDMATAGADLPELLKGGGSIKCCTLEVHP